MSIEALLARKGALLAGTTDGRLLSWPVEGGHVGEPTVVREFEGPVTSIASRGDDVLVACGPFLFRIGADAPLLECDHPIAALAVRGGRVCALAGNKLHVLDDLVLANVIVLPTEKATELDLDRKGRRAFVVEQPHSGFIIDLETGEKVGSIKPAQWMAKRARAMDGRFSPNSDHVYVAYHGAHHIVKCSPRGKTVGELSQSPSTWCTPLATTEDARWLVSRQSGIGVVAWDLASESDDYVIFAELDPDTDYQAKFDKRMAVAPAAVKELAPGAIKVTRWKPTRVLDGDATAIAVAPDCAYLATGDREDRVTVVDFATRRIARSDGEIVQPACLVASVAIPDREESHALRVGDSLVFVSHGGEVSSLDLASNERATRGKIDVGETFHVEAHASDLVVFDGKRVRRFDLALACKWSFDDPLPGCKFLSFDGDALVGMEGLDVRRFDPMNRVELKPIRVRGAESALRTDELEVSGRGGRLFVSGWSHEGDHLTHRLERDGALGASLGERATLLPDGAHVLAQSIHGWSIAHVDALERPIHRAELENVTLGLTHVDLDRGLAIGQDMHTRRVHVYDLGGAKRATFDALGPVYDFFFAPNAGSVWMLEQSAIARRYSVISDTATSR